MLSPCGPTRVIRESGDDPNGLFPGDYLVFVVVLRDLPHALLWNAMIGC